MAEIEEGKRYGLDSEEMNSILMDAVAGRPCRLKKPGAEEFWKEMVDYVYEVAAKGGYIDIPNEFPDIDLSSDVGDEPAPDLSKKEVKDQPAKN